MKHAKEHARAAKVDKRKSKCDNSDAESSDDEDHNCAGVDDEDEIWKVNLVLHSCQRDPISTDD